MFKTLKIAALATTVIIATAGASLAATFAYVDQDANVRKNHSNLSQVVNFVHEGQQVKVVGQAGPWYKIQIPGKDGWVKAGVLDFDNWGPGPFPGNGPGFCINGPHASFCINN